MANIRFLGHSSFEIQLGGRTILTDPWFERNPVETKRLVPPAANAESFRKVDLILISHEHYDHCSPSDVQTICSRTQAQVIAPEDALMNLAINPRLKMPVSPGDSFSVLGLDLEVIAAKHPQSTNPVGFIVSNGSKRIYFAGDTYESSEMTRIACDLAMIPIGGTYTMDVLGAVKALKLMRAKFVVPMHYNTFARIEVDTRDFEKRVAEGTHSKPVVLDPGEGFTV
ncbi:metal-dependent hydrolase [Candidatus Micrarchaeota archaeon]|nr:metal-dependent hydrolase [Candidatus Micrarchaeota archaeon]